MRDLTEIREQINRIDSDLFALFLERMEASADVAEYKRATGKPIFDMARERSNIKTAASRVPTELASHAMVIQSVLMEASREAQYKALGRRSTVAASIEDALGAAPTAFPRTADVACQGVEGSYQQIAADRIFHHPMIAYHDSFEDVFAAVEHNEVQFGVLPVENSTAGPVNQVYDLMMRHNFYIVRSCRLKIDHNLLVKPGTAKANVRVVYSHQQAISQCASYLAQIPNCTVHVCENTAVAAQMVAESDREDVAALASSSCATLYGLAVADKAVQDRQNNYTRFACIAKDLAIYPGAERSSLMMVLPNEPGSLCDILARFFALDINLVRLESRPIPGRDFELMFYLDIECPAAAPEFCLLMDSLPEACQEFRYLGSYTEVL